MFTKNKFQIIAISLIAILAFSCTKDDVNKVDSSSSNGTNSIAQYVAFWKLARYQYRVSTGQWFQPQTSYSPVSCILNLKSTQASTPNYYECDFSGVNCNPLSLVWRISTPGFIEIQLQQYYVQKLTSDSLIITKGDSLSQSIYEVYRYYK
ncbi:MAG: hypothetical protein RL516_2010 [Bacteroidota bacterium]|jgi:hypothetical protein